MGSDASLLQTLTVTAIHTGSVVPVPFHRHLVLRLSQGRLRSFHLLPVRDHKVILVTIYSIDIFLRRAFSALPALGLRRVCFCRLAYAMWPPLESALAAFRRMTVASPCMDASVRYGNSLIAAGHILITVLEPASESQRVIAGNNLLDAEQIPEYYNTKAAHCMLTYECNTLLAATHISAPSSLYILEAETLSRFWY